MMVSTQNFLQIAISITKRCFEFGEFGRGVDENVWFQSMDMMQSVVGISHCASYFPILREPRHGIEELDRPCRVIR